MPLQPMKKNKFLDQGFPKIYGNTSRIKLNRTLVLLMVPFLIVVGLGVNLQLVKGDQNGMNLPPGFAEQTIVDGLDFPVDMEFLPSGDILVAEKGAGQFEDSWSSIKLIRNGSVQKEAVLTLSTNSYWDSGLLALVIDPDFATNKYFYVWYATGINSSGWTGESKLRLSRFVLNSQSGTADPASETIILEDEPWYEIHHGNALLFDGEGNLFLGMGNRGDLSASQDLSRLYGKVIRIRPNDLGYDIPPDNPYLNNPNARPEIYTIGFRNPFRLARRVEDGLIVLGDVGAATWEEIDIMSAGSNYGFPEREGPCPYGQLKPCDPAPAYYTDPAITYAHDESLGTGTSGAVTGMAFYEGTGFPQEYWNKLLFSDFNQDFIASADPQSGTFQLFADNTEDIVDIEYFNEGIYLLEIRTGRIKLVFYSGQENQVPKAVLSAVPQKGPSPLKVTFSAAGSTDPDDNILKYHWDFGDGTAPLVTDEIGIEHTYIADGSYQASLKVVDIRGGESSPVEETITVYSGEFPTINLKNLTDAGRELYHGGDAILYEAVRSNLDGLDPEQPFLWQVDFHHNQHVHPLITNSPVISDVLSISTDNHGGDWNIWYQFHLKMITETGQEVTVSQEVFPELVDLTIDSRPPSAQIVINEARQISPHPYRAIVGTEQYVQASPRSIYENDIWVFSHWQTAGEVFSSDPKFMILAPTLNTTFTAAYVYDRPAERMWLPLIAN